MNQFIKKIILVLLLLPCLAMAHNIQLNQQLKNVQVTDLGQLQLEQKTISYIPWSVDSLKSKVRVINHIAGRSFAKELNEPLMQAIRQANFSKNKYQTTTIINKDDAIFGTGGFVKSSAEKGKKNNPWSMVVLDANSAVQKAWQLQPKNSAIIVLDATGKVQFVNEGALSEPQVQHVITVLKSLLAK